MADDREVLKEVWDGKIPICFRLSLDEVVSSEQPTSLYLLVSRQTYFPIGCEKVHRHFISHVAADDNVEMWLEYEGQPLKWHYPVGVLFDLHTRAIPLLPWNLTVHFQNFPEGQLMHCQSKDVVEAHFMSRLKEADWLKHKGDVINAMQKKDHAQLWLGLKNDRFEQFWEVNRKLMEHREELFKHIPFCIHQSDKPALQKLYKPMSGDGNINTLQNLFQSVLPCVLSEPDKYRVVIQGLEPPLETPVQWLSEHLSHPDNFLHICVIQT